MGGKDHVCLTCLKEFTPEEFRSHRCGAKETKENGDAESDATDAETWPWPGYDPDLAV